MKEHQNEEMEIDLLELFFHLLSKWKFLLLGLIVGAVVAGGATFLKAPVYESESMLFILSKTTSITSVADLQIGSTLSGDFALIAKSKPVLDTAIDQVKEETGKKLTRDEILKMLTVTNQDDTRVLTIAVQNTDAEVACSVANAVTEATASQMASIMKSDPPTTVEKAEVATEPEDNGMTKNVAIGAIVGLLLVAILFTIPFLTNDKIKTPEDVEKYLEVGILGVMPVDKSQEFKSKSKTKKKGTRGK